MHYEILLSERKQQYQMETCLKWNHVTQILLSRDN
jgi:hypothetical protein